MSMADKKKAHFYFVELALEDEPREILEQEHRFVAADVIELQIQRLGERALVIETVLHDSRQISMDGVDDQIGVIRDVGVAELCDRSHAGN